MSVKYQNKSGGRAGSGPGRPKRIGKSKVAKDFITSQPRSTTTSISGSTMKYPRTGKRGAPQVFPRKLFEILENEHNDIISWNETGDSFVIKDMDYFTTNVLMKYFRHQKYSSFQRQLNLYGFRKISKGADTGAYTHDHFVKDGTDMLTLVRRMPQSSSRSSGSGSSSSTPKNSSSSAKKSATPASSASSQPLSQANGRGKNTIATAVSRLSECVKRSKNSGRRIRIKHTSAAPESFSSSSKPTTVKASSVSQVQVASRPQVHDGSLAHFPVAAATPVHGEHAHAFDMPSTPVHTTQPAPAPSRSSSSDTSEFSDECSLQEEDFVDGPGGSLLRMGSNFEFTFGELEGERVDRVRDYGEEEKGEVRHQDPSSFQPGLVGLSSGAMSPMPLTETSTRNCSGAPLPLLSPVVTFQPTAMERSHLAKALGESDPHIKVLSEHVSTIHIGEHQQSTEAIWIKSQDQGISDETMAIPSLVPLTSTISSLGFSVDDVAPQGDMILDDDKSMHKLYTSGHIATTATLDFENDFIKSRCRSVSMSSDDWGIPSGIDDKLAFDEFAFPSTPMHAPPDCVEMER